MHKDEALAHNVGKRNRPIHIARHKRNSALLPHEEHLIEVEQQKMPKQKPLLYRVPPEMFSMDEAALMMPKQNPSFRQIADFRRTLGFKVVCPNCKQIHKLKTRKETHVVQQYETFFGKMIPEGAPKSMEGHSPNYRPIQCKCNCVIVHPDWKAPEKKP